MTEKDFEIAERFYDELYSDIKWIIRSARKNNIYLIMNGDICSAILTSIVFNICKDNPNYNIINIITHNDTILFHDAITLETNSMLISNAFNILTYPVDISDQYKSMLKTFPDNKNIAIDIKTYLYNQLTHTYINTLAAINDAIIIDPTSLTDICINGNILFDRSPFLKIWKSTIESIAEMLIESDNILNDTQKEYIKYILDQSTLNNTKDIDLMLNRYLYIDGRDSIDSFIIHRPEYNNETSINILNKTKKHIQYTEGTYYLYGNDDY